MQQIVLLVDKESPALEAEGLAAVALASVNAYLAAPDLPEWRAWAAGHFGKSVRRADARTYPKILAAFADELGGVEGECGKGRAVAFAPLPQGTAPKKLAKLQVSGTALPRTPAERAEWLAARGPGEAELEAAEAQPDAQRGDADGEVPGDAVVLIVNDDLGMSTGKAAAQSAHALFAWLLRAIPKDIERVDAWLAAEQPTYVRFAAADEFTRLSRQATGPLIRDAGRTEITPGSTTAFVL
nr:peptidyl-tRNA hydrolase [Zhihengliuella flava]